MPSGKGLFEARIADVVLPFRPRVDLRVEPPDNFSWRVDVDGPVRSGPSRSGQRQRELTSFPSKVSTTCTGYSKPSHPGGARRRGARLRQALWPARESPAQSALRAQRRGTHSSQQAEIAAVARRNSLTADLRLPTEVGALIGAVRRLCSLGRRRNRTRVQGCRPLPDHDARCAVMTCSRLTCGFASVSERVHASFAL